MDASCADKTEAYKQQIPEVTFEDALIRFLVYPLESGRSAMQVHVPSERRPLLCWGACLIPEFWFLWNEIWGVSIMIWFFEFLMISNASSHIGFMNSWLLGAGIVRLLSAFLGHRIFYYRHGRWAVS